MKNKTAILKKLKALKSKLAKLDELKKADKENTFAWVEYNETHYRIETLNWVLGVKTDN